MSDPGVAPPRNFVCPFAFRNGAHVDPSVDPDRGPAKYVRERNGSLSEGDLDINNAKAMDPNIAKEFADYGVQ